ncbi:hypothetical protein VZT92_002601 [Zoarces viviparus]|uniref:Uncharacterized protein n=1 Tax=Zoarces viviparus TaxID=48416 RepID=A0AAW1G005_ZOAVI
MRARTCEPKSLVDLRGIAPRVGGSSSEALHRRLFIGGSSSQALHRRLFIGGSSSGGSCDAKEGWGGKKDNLKENTWHN